MAEKSQNPFSLLACSLGLVLGAPPVLGQSFPELEARLKEHPALEALRLESSAFREDALAAVAWPDPVVSVGINNFPLSDPSFRSYLPTNKALGVSQQIPNRSARAARSAQARRGAVRNEALEAMQFAHMRSELLVALLDRRRIAEELALLHRQDSLYTELEQIVQGEIAAGRPVLFRLAEIDLQRAEVARSLADLQAEDADVDARLADLVGGVGAVPLPPIEPTIWSGNPDAFHAVRLAGAEVAVAEAGVERAQAAWKPDWGVQLTWQQRDSGGTDVRFPGDDWVSAAVTFSVPIWGNRSQAPALRAARAQRESAVSRRTAAARAAAARYSALDATRRAAEAAMGALNAKVPAIREQVAAQRTRYESGTGDYSPIIDGELAELVLLARIAREQARRDSAVARLNSLMVTP
ncbi:MAG: TolC family protein [Gammaproteobacteria bacterium]|nr:TolC family protein [Gammaproteobacteria bacterium]